MPRYDARALILFALFLQLALPVAASERCLVVGIADGDTVTARCGEPGAFRQVRIRLAEIDAPEKAQPFGQRSRAQLGTLCFGVEATIRPQTTDRYGRIVARVECRGRDGSTRPMRAIGRSGRWRRRHGPSGAAYGLTMQVLRRGLGEKRKSPDPKDQGVKTEQIGQEKWGAKTWP